MREEILAASLRGPRAMRALGTIRARRLASLTDAPLLSERTFADPSEPLAYAGSMLAPVAPMALAPRLTYAGGPAMAVRTSVETAPRVSPVRFDPSGGGGRPPTASPPPASEEPPPELDLAVALDEARAAEDAHTGGSEDSCAIRPWLCNRPAEEPPAATSGLWARYKWWVLGLLLIAGSGFAWTLARRRR